MYMYTLSFKNFKICSGEQLLCTTHHGHTRGKQESWSYNTCTVHRRVYAWLQCCKLNTKTLHRQKHCQPEVGSDRVTHLLQDHSTVIQDPQGPNGWDVLSDDVRCVGTRVQQTMLKAAVERIALSTVPHHYLHEKINKLIAYTVHMNVHWTITLHGWYHSNSRLRS